MKFSIPEDITMTLNKKRLVKIFLSLILLQSGFLRANDQISQSEENEAFDRALITSLSEGNYIAAENLLKKGANPESVFGPKLSDNAVCTAIDDRSSKYLELLMNHGASANAYWNVGNELRTTPLVCAVNLLNFEAFDLLLRNGADPSVDLNKNSSEEYRNSTTAFTVALSGKRYTMALALLKLYTLHPAELKRLVFDLETGSYDEAHPWNKARDELIEWTRERVPAFNPRMANPRNGTEPDCLFSFRDHEEGLKKGTICWEEKDK